jgi:hypothetical protein
MMWPPNYAAEAASRGGFVTAYDTIDTVHSQSFLSCAIVFSEDADRRNFVWRAMPGLLQCGVRLEIKARSGTYS